jgi:hypothetical protein
MLDGDTLERVVEEMRDVLKQVFGIMLDARQGFYHVAQKTEEVQKKLLYQVPGATIQNLDASLYAYNDGPPQHEPDDPKAPWLHRTTQGELKRRNRRGALNDVFIGNMCLVALYTYWEDEYRNKFATALGKPRDKVRVPVLGDVRLIRNSIVHHRAVALEEIEKCTTLLWFKAGDAIDISDDRFREMVRLIDSWLDAVIRDRNAA